MKYYILYNDQNHGPLEIEELEQYGLSPASRVWAPGWTEWKDASDVPEIKDYFDNRAAELQAQRERAKAEEDARRKEEARQAAEQFKAAGSAENRTGTSNTAEAKAGVAALPGAASDEAMWHLAINNEEVGEFRKQDLIAAGMMPDSLVWTEGMPDWEEAGRVSELADFFKKCGKNRSEQPLMWHMVIKDKEQGPYKTEELIAKGLEPSTPVWTEGMPDWLPARDVARLSDLFAGSQTAPRTSVPRTMGAVNNRADKPLNTWGMPVVALVAVIAAVALYFMKTEYFFGEEKLTLFVIFNLVPVLATLMAVVCASMASDKEKKGDVRGASVNSGIAVGCSIMAVVSSIISIVYACKDFDLL